MQSSKLYDAGFWPELPDIQEEMPVWGLLEEACQPDFAKCVKSNPGSAVAQVGSPAPGVREPSASNAEALLLSEPLPSGKTSRKTTQNREAQQRFRQRHKARMKGLESQLNEATSRVSELQIRQLQLEARNALLQAVADSALKSTPSEAASATASLHLVDAQQSVTLIVMSNQLVKKTVQELSKMPFTQFSSLYAAYAGKISQCLLQQSQPCTDGSTDLHCLEVSDELRRWTDGINRLRIFLAVGNAKDFVGYVASRLDGHLGPSARQLSDAWYHNLIGSLRLTEAQKLGMLHIRRLFYARLGALRRQRKQLLQQVPTGLQPEALASFDASSRLSEVAASAQQLQENSAAELRAHFHVSAFLRLSTEGRGILTMRQQAACIVGAFPYAPDKLRVLEALASVRHEPSVSELMQPNGLDDFEHYANWQQIVHLLQQITKDNLHLHIPLVHF